MSGPMKPLNPPGMDPMNPANSSIPLPGGGDTHIHPFGPKENDFVVTTRLPGGIDIHDKPFDFNE